MEQGSYENENCFTAYALLKRQQGQQGQHLN